MFFNIMLENMRPIMRINFYLEFGKFKISAFCYATCNRSEFVENIKYYLQEVVYFKLLYFIG